MNPGTRIGPYDVIAELGAGGMGQVYRARDARLHREVALKILPALFAADSERLARFEREAQVLAALNHPNIAQIYGLEETAAQGAPGTRALVIELVEGDTLADRIARGPIPLAEALAVAGRIADALDAAHERGVIHRDLKPANIKVSEAGAVKVLDFGLAKLADSRPVELTATSTVTSPVLETAAGALLGTAAYMSPEQARGRAADRRADIWAFGVIVYEMVTGERPFGGNTIADVLASVVRDDVDLTRVPEGARDIVRACLEKDPARRLRDIGDLPRVRTQAASAQTASPQVPLWRRALPYAVTTLLAAAAAGTPVWLALRPSAVAPTRLSFPLQSPLAALGRTTLAISPDGRRVAYVSNNQLLLRDLGEFDARTIAGTPFGSVYLMAPAFSADGNSIAFWSSDFGIKRVSTSGGPTTNVARVDDVPNGVAWIGDDLYFTPSGRRLERVSSNGGQPETLVTFTADEDAYGPRFLPDRDHVLLTVTRRNADYGTARIVVQSLRSGERRTLVDSGRDPYYLRTGHLVYAVGGVLFASSFDPATLERHGAAVPFVQGVLGTDSSTDGLGAAAQFAVSDTGTLVYVPGRAAISGGQDLAIVERDGTLKPLHLPLRNYRHVRVSPDDRHIAFTIDAAGDSNVWVVDLDGGAAARQLTAGGTNRYPIWSADGVRVTFAADRDGGPGLFSQPADGSTPPERLTSAERGTLHMPECWSASGDRLLYTVTRDAKVTLWVYSARDKTSSRFGDIQTGTPTGAAFSPDGRWIAYAADNTVFVQPFPSSGARYQVSMTNGGHHPVWSRDGRELWFESGPSQLVAVPVTASSTFVIGAARSLPSAQFGSTAPQNARNRDVMSGGRWISPIPGSEASPDDAAGAAALQMRVVLNWFEELTRTVPAK